jgi:hypothetical protein
MIHLTDRGIAKIKYKRAKNQKKTGRKLLIYTNFQKKYGFTLQIVYVFTNHLVKT